MGMKVVIAFDDTDNTTFEYDDKNGLKSVNVSTTSSDNAEDISYGIVSNYGDCELVDSTMSMSVFLASQTFSTFTVSIYNDGEIVGKFFGSRSISYDIYTGVCQFDFRGLLEKLQLVNYSLKYDKQLHNATAYTIYEKLVAESASFVFDLDSDTKTFLQSITIEYPYLERNTLWEQWGKLAQIAQLRIYMRENGTVRVERYE